MDRVIHYLDVDDVIACGCSQAHPSWTFASAHVTCPDCQRVLQGRRGRDWIGDVAHALDSRRWEAAMAYTCDACGTSKDEDSRDGHVPPGWRLQQVGKCVVLLCEGCRFLSVRDRTSTVLLDMLRARGIDVDKRNR